MGGYGMKENTQLGIVIPETTLIPDLPVYQDDLAKIKAKKPQVNALQEIVIEIMNELGLKDVEVVKETKIPFTTFYDWVSGQTRTQLADENLLKLFVFFREKMPDLTLEYLIYGTGHGPGEKDAS